MPLIITIEKLINQENIYKTVLNNLNNILHLIDQEKAFQYSPRQGSKPPGLYVGLSGKNVDTLIAQLEKIKQIEYKLYVSRQESIFVITACNCDEIIKFDAQNRFMLYASLLPAAEKTDLGKFEFTGGAEDDFEFVNKWSAI